MVRHLMPAIMVTALLLAASTAAFANDKASAAANLGRVAANDTANDTVQPIDYDAIPPKPVKKKLHHPASAWPVKKVAAVTDKKKTTAAADNATKTN